MADAKFILGNAIEQLEKLEPESFDACVTDPPYALTMADWDGRYSPREYQRFCWLWALAVRHALKPGAFLLSFGSPRTAHRQISGIEDAGFEILDSISWLCASRKPASRTRLKPAGELICVAQKPGPGALNIDACKLASGRWPPNVVLDEGAATLLDAQSGILKSGSAPGGLHRHTDKHRHAYSRFRGQVTEEDPTYGDAGGASRFFYCARAAPAERNAGCEDLYWDLAGDDPRLVTRAEWAVLPEADQGHGNVHPTCKPIALMRWLVRLAVPPGGSILDPFCGSGSTGVAAKLEGHNFVGIDLCSAYLTIAERRHAAWTA